MWSPRQVFCQPVFSSVETCVAASFPNAKFLINDRTLHIGKNFKYHVNLLRLIWRTAFVTVGTFLAILMPFFNAILSFLGAVGFWPLAVYFPIEMYISQQQIQRSSNKWKLLQALSMLCLLVSLCAAVGSVQGVVKSLEHYTPFKTKS